MSIPFGQRAKAQAGQDRYGLANEHVENLQKGDRVTIEGMGGEGVVERITAEYGLMQVWVLFGTMGKLCNPDAITKVTPPGTHP